MPAPSAGVLVEEEEEEEDGLHAGTKPRWSMRGRNVLGSGRFCSSDPELTEAGGEAGPAALEAAEILPWKMLPVWGGASSALR